MKNTRFVAALATLALLPALGACGSAADGSASAEEADAEETSSEEPAVERASVPSGSAMSLTLDRKLSPENAEKGTEFTATVASPVTDGRRVLVPEGATVHGRVTAMQNAEGDRPAVVKLAFESVDVRGRSYPLVATLTSAEVKTDKKLKGEGKKIGGGAAAGGLVGGILSGNAKGALIGAAAGAAAGTGIALGTQDKTAYLPAGAALEIQLEEALRVRL